MRTQGSSLWSEPLWLSECWALRAENRFYAIFLDGGKLGERTVARDSTLQKLYSFFSVTQWVIMGTARNIKLCGNSHSLSSVKPPKTITILKFCVTPLGLYLTFTNCFQIIWWRHFTPTRVKRTKQNVRRGRVGTCLILVQNASCSSQKSSPFHCRCGQSLRHMAPLYWLCCRAHVLRAHCRIYLCTDFTIISEMPFHLSSLLWAQIGLSLFL